MDRARCMVEEVTKSAGASEAFVMVNTRLKFVRHGIYEARPASSIELVNRLRHRWSTSLEYAQYRAYKYSLKHNFSNERKKATKRPPFSFNKSQLLWQKSQLLRQESQLLWHFTSVKCHRSWDRNWQRTHWLTESCHVTWDWLSQ